jgi:hypothetical protein
MAGSSYHGRFVAPKTRIPWSSLPTPCIWTKNSVLTLLEASFPYPPYDLLPHIESTSSINIIDGFLSLAILNRVFINFSLYPTYLLIRSEDDTEKNVPSA